MSSRDYVSVPGFPGLRVCVRPFTPHSRSIILCYVGTIPELIAAGVANLEMLTTVKWGFDAAGGHYTTDAPWSTHGGRPQKRHRIWRKMKHASALRMPGVREALAHAADVARRAATTGIRSPCGSNAGFARLGSHQGLSAKVATERVPAREAPRVLAKSEAGLARRA